MQGQTLNATNGIWEGAGPSYHYQWLNCDENGENCTDTETGDDDSSYTLTADDVGDTIRVIVTAANDSGAVGATSDATDPVTPEGPSNTGAPVITGTTQQGQTLTTTDGSWDGDPSRSTTSGRTATRTDRTAATPARTPTPTRLGRATSATRFR